MNDERDRQAAGTPVGSRQDSKSAGVDEGETPLSAAGPVSPASPADNGLPASGIADGTTGPGEVVVGTGGGASPDAGERTRADEQVR